MSEYKQLWCILTKNQTDAVMRQMEHPRTHEGSLNAPDVVGRIVLDGGKEIPALFYTKAEAEACLKKYQCREMYYVAVMAWKVSS